MKHDCVLLADDYHPMLEAIRGLLEIHFETVVMVASVESLLEAAKRIKPDLIVADLSLPSSDNSTLLGNLKDSLPEYKVIILGAYDDATAVKRILKQGVKGYVIKRAAATDLIPAVETVFMEKTYISPSAASQGEK